MLVGYHGALTAMDNGGDFGSGRLDWDIKSSAASWDWDNMVMLSGRKATDWGEEAPPGNGSSGIPGIAATGTSTGQPTTCGPLEIRYPDRNSFDARSMAGGLPQGDRSGSADGKEGPASAAASSQQQPSKAFLGLAAGVQEEKAGKEELKQAANGGAHDAELKLGIGKRSYCEPKAAVASPSNNASATSKPSPSGKKPRGSSAAHTPRCQVEGCKTDLSSAKDYHRRHKVCAMHSKSAKVCVNSIDQRFCQQCSRFHVLSEFDEGKRSCRRRLAGHNERRRKPQPDPMALASTYHQAELVRRALALTRGDERLLSYGLVPPLSILGLNDYTKLGYGKAGVDDYSHRSALSLMLVPRKPSFTGSHGVHQFMQGSTSMGQTLSLSSTAETGLFAGMGPSNHLPQGGAASDPGRALSLLSSQSWASTGAPDSVASQKPSSLALEQLINENSRAAFNGSQQQACNSSSRHQNYAHDEKLLQVPHDGNSRLQQQQQQPTYLPTMGGVPSNGYESQNLTLLQESDFRGLQHHYQQATTRPTIDLMRSNNGSSCNGGVQQQQQHQSGTNNFQQVLKPYGLYDQPQQPL